MEYRHILYAVDDAIATLTLNRPEVLNAYVPEMGDELVDAFGRARDDEAVRAVILTGAGRAFCAGVDLKYLERQREGGGSGRRLGEEDFVRAMPLELARFPKPIVVALNGAAIGVGVTMTLPCDIRIAADTARLGLTFTRLGMLPGLGSTHLLPKIVGLGRALELVLTAQLVDAAEAARIGLVSRVVTPEALMQQARETARQAADCDPRAQAAAKRALHHGASVSLEEALAAERGRAG